PLAAPRERRLVDGAGEREVPALVRRGGPESAGGAPLEVRQPPHGRELAGVVGPVLAGPRKVALAIVLGLDHQGSDVATQGRGGERKPVREARSPAAGVGPDLVRGEDVGGG